MLLGETDVHGSEPNPAGAGVWTQYLSHSNLADGLARGAVINNLRTPVLLDVESVLM